MFLPVPIEYVRLTGGVRTLLCHMEPCGKGAWCGQDQRLYLHGSCHNGGDFRAGAEGAGDVGFHYGGGSGGRRAFPF